MAEDIFAKVIAFIQNSAFSHLVLGILLLSVVVYVTHIAIERASYKAMKVFGAHLPDFLRDMLVDERLFRKLAILVPVLIVHQSVGFLPYLSDSVITLIKRFLVVWLIVISIQVIKQIFSRIDAVYASFPVSKVRPIKGYLQVATILLYIFGIIVSISVLMDQSPVVFLSGLGALTAVILLVFRDTLLSFVAGIQITSNNLVRVGDWIEMPQFGADGEVIEIALHAVRVQNWDRTITYIPTHKFLDNSFKNWRGMQDSGGRRIKRSIFIDMSSIGFLSDEDIQYFGRFALLKEYMAQKTQELTAYNQQYASDDHTIVNGRRLTNIGTFRAYVAHYLRQHPNIHQNMAFLVRQLQPTPEGLPLEIYVFVNDTRWAIYEGVQSDVFDHILSMVPKFKLRVYQRPSSHDMQGSSFDELGQN